MAARAHALRYATVTSFRGLPRRPAVMSPCSNISARLAWYASEIFSRTPGLCRYSAMYSLQASLFRRLHAAFDARMAIALSSTEVIFLGKDFSEARRTKLFSGVVETMSEKDSNDSISQCLLRYLPTSADTEALEHCIEDKKNTLFGRRRCKKRDLDVDTDEEIECVSHLMKLQRALSKLHYFVGTIDDPKCEICAYAYRASTMTRHRTKLRCCDKTLCCECYSKIEACPFCRSALGPVLCTMCLCDSRFDAAE